MWGDTELIRLALEALCLLAGSITAAVVARRRSAMIGALAGFVAGVVLWLLLLVVQLRWFANWS